MPVERNYKNQRKASYQQKVLESLSEDRNEGRSERKRKKELSMFEIIK